MRMRISATLSLFSVALTLGGVLNTAGRAQEMRAPASSDFHTSASNLIIPQARAYTIRPEAQRVQISAVHADVRILHQVATTTMDVSLSNSSNQQQEAEMLVPVPDGAAVRSFTFAGSASEPTAKLLPKAEARSIYQSIVSKLRDPALLEFAGYNLVRSSVFPVPARGTQRVRLVYEHLLTAEGNRIDYVLPRSESFEARETPWTITTAVQAKSPISAIYSPSHQITVAHTAPGHAVVRVGGEPKLEPGPFRISYLLEGNGLTASLLAYPDARIGGGYFLLLAGAPASARAENRPAIKREVTLVFDRSGSMKGEKFEQARAAALQVVEGLDEGEAFNVIDYSDSIASFAPRPVVKTPDSMREARSYIKRLAADGGTNIHAALIEALRQPPTAGTLPLIIFLTDGLPTVGETRETAIRRAVIATNPHERRIFTFGVGYDVNAPLLTSIANATRATGTFVFPTESVEAKVSQVFRRLSGPVLAAPQLATLDANRQATTRAVRELLPAELSDLFEGDQIVLLGQYRGDEPLRFRISGNYFGTPRIFDFKFDLNSATTRNAFVPRLWASRKIARLVEEISEAGADVAQMARAGSHASAMRMSRMPVSVSDVSAGATDPKLKELVDEIVRLSTEYGVLTEYTAFLATDGTDFSRREALNEQAQRSLVENAQQTRSGMGGVTQIVNRSAQGAQTSANRANTFLTQNMERIEITNVQQVTDRTFFRRNNRWIDARLLHRERTIEPDQIIEFGTPEFYRLTDRLVAEGRQSIMALLGEMLLLIDGKTVLIKAPPAK